MISEEKQTPFTEFLVDGLLRGDIQSRYNAYHVVRNERWMSANDIRALENMNPIAEGDSYWQPLNMIKVGEEPKTQESKSKQISTERRDAENAIAARRQATLSWRPMIWDTAE